MSEGTLTPTARAAAREDRDAALDRLAAQVEALEVVERGNKPFKHILAAVDESRQAGWALDVAARTAAEVSARLTLFHAVDVAARLTPEMSLAGVTRTALLGAGECFLQEAKMRLPKGLNADLVLRDGPAAEEIVSAAEACGADLIVMGTHGRGRLGTFLIGSTAEAVVRLARCPVLTVAHDPAAAGAARAGKPGVSGEAGAESSHAAESAALAGT